MTNTLFQQNELSKTKTVCKDCVFAVYEEKTQTGCSINKLEYFKERGAEIVEAYDEEKEFYIISGKICMWCRGPKWGGKHNKKDWEHDARMEMQFPYHAIINKVTSLDSLVVTLDSLYSQDIRPKEITVVRELDSPVSPSDITDILDRREGVKWHVQTMLNEESKPIDIAVKKTKLAYYMVINAGVNIPSLWVNTVDRKINEETWAFGLITFDGGYIVPHIIHHILVGNSVKPLKEKLLENDYHKYIYTMEDVLS